MIAGGWTLALTTGVVVNPVFPRFQFFSFLGDGSFRFTISGEANKDYAVEASMDLVNWTELGTVTTAGDGLAQFTDGTAPESGNRYYRAVSAP